MRTTVSLVVAVVVAVLILDLGVTTRYAWATPHPAIPAAMLLTAAAPPIMPPVKPNLKPAPPKPTPKAPPNLATQLSKEPELVAILQPLLPGGLTVNAAAMGFRNLGQF